MRKLLPVALVLALSVLCSVPAARAQEPAHEGFAKANSDQVHAFIMLIRLRGDLFGKWKDTGKWPDDAAANEALGAHSKYWREQLKSGRAILAGGMDGEYWDNVALIIFEAGSLAEAQELVRNDPAVKAYVFQAQVRPFSVNWISNKYDSSFRKPVAPK